MERWQDNRIGWSQGADDEGAIHYRYDDWGNRTEARHGDGSTTALHYDGLHQLRQVTRIDPQGQVQSKTTYRYDAFGRRVSKTHQQTDEESQATHYGWDGDRLVHTQSHGHIQHTVYEPGSFVPLLQIERHKDGQTNPVKTLLALAGSGDAQAQEPELQQCDQEMLHQALKEVLQPGYQLSALLPQEMRSQVQESLQLIKDTQAHIEDTHPLTIRHFVTDHLGTPIALVDANGQEAGQVSWAARYGAWGEIEQEYNPRCIHQPIRLQGQQLDAETGLHYNRFRYYDPGVGRYVTQDPIGLQGGINNFSYAASNPLKYADALGLCPCGSPTDLINSARLDKRDWSQQADRRDINSGFGSGTYKCNLFADTQYENSGYSLPNMGGSPLSRLLEKYPPGAGELSKPGYQVPGWPTVSGPAQPGDLVASGGHVGIATSSTTTISASPSGVIENKWGFRPDQQSVIRRCTCAK
ncbi:RHS repeat-associated core domain-containing protein [Acidovorax sp. LjRoot194]|uniref:RHS repeat-associated core domain-containing protein n=1 Tax=Acidovorax sp. LjRoot194 TaxID=3342280 RepID=UPI003ECDDEC3